MAVLCSLRVLEYIFPVLVYLDQEKSGNPAIEAGVSAVVFQPQSMIYFIASEALFEKDQKCEFYGNCFSVAFERVASSRPSQKAGPGTTTSMQT
jgi:hypothetical protein